MIRIKLKNKGKIWGNTFQQHVIPLKRETLQIHYIFSMRKTSYITNFLNLYNWRNMTHGCMQAWIKYGKCLKKKNKNKLVTKEHDTLCNIPCFSFCISIKCIKQLIQYKDVYNYTVFINYFKFSGMIRHMRIVVIK